MKITCLALDCCKNNFSPQNENYTPCIRFFGTKNKINLLNTPDDIFEYKGKNVSFNGIQKKFSINQFNEMKALFEEIKIINGQKEYTNIDDFIRNGKQSKLAKNISILGAAFDYCQPFKLKTEATTVGKHLTEVVRHLYHDNEEFKKLSDEDKKLLLKVAVFHDIGKIENRLYKYQLIEPNFEEIIRQRIKKYEIFNEPADYIKNIKAYFEKNPNESEIILHNNIHPKISVDFLNEYIKTSPENKKEFEKIKLLVLNHQIFGEVIDKYNNNLINEFQFNHYAKKFATDINDPKLLKLIMFFHLSDAAGVYKNNSEYYNRFKNQLYGIYNKSIEQRRVEQ